LSLGERKEDMRRAMVAVLAVSILAPGLSGCGSSTGTEGQESLSLLEQSGEVVVAYGDEVPVGGSVIRVAFGEVRSDSRCPVDAVCVWQGNAEVELGIRAGMGPTHALRMNTNLDPRFADWQGIRVTLLELLPVPSAGVRIEPQEYSVRLRLEPLD